MSWMEAVRGLGTKLPMDCCSGKLAKLKSILITLAKYWILLLITSLFRLLALSVSKTNKPMCQLQATK